MQAYLSAAEIIRDITENKRGFKTAFYEYVEQNKNEVGTRMKQLYSLSINVYKNLNLLQRVVKEVIISN